MFHAPFWLKNPHLQTLWAAGLHQGVFVRKHWERVELPDGDFVDLCWDASVFEETERPLAMILHGLEGSVYSPYAAGQMKNLARIGFRPFTFHFRGCSGEPNRHDRNYHSGDTGDIAYVVQMLKERHPSVPIVAVGYSMGANALIKWLGDTGEENPLAAACAVSPPFVLSAAADRIDEGFSKFYQWILIDSLKAKLREKFENRPCPIDLSCVPKIRNFWEFDDWITAPLNGFKDVHEYYSIASCRQYLPRVKIPLLVIHAKDDPFLYPEFIPEKSEFSKATHFELSERGGHVGFVSGLGRYYLETRIPAFFTEKGNLLR